MNKNFKLVCGLAAALPVAIATVSMVDALAHHSERNDACKQKIARLTRDFYNRAPAGEEPILKKVSLDEHEIPTSLGKAPQLIKSKQCDSQTGGPQGRRPAWARGWTP